MHLLVNIDIPDLPAAEALYTAAFGLTSGRRFGTGAVELLGASAPIYLLAKRDGSQATANSLRDYARHWTPLHLDVVVENLESALARAEQAGLRRETDIRSQPWGRIVQLADPFGHGWCLVEFSAAGYDAIAD